VLTKIEAAWVRRLQKVLDDCPARIGFFTIGDPNLTMYDKAKEADFSRDRDLPNEVDRCDARLGDVRFTSHVHGVCG